MDESRLWMSNFLNGNDQAFDALVERWTDPLFRYFLLRTRSWHVAEDLTQTTLVRLFESRQGAAPYDGERPFQPWLFGIAHHVFLDHLDRRPQPQQPAEDWNLVDRSPAGKPPSARLERAERLERLLQCCERELTEREKTVLYLSEKGLGSLHEFEAEQVAAFGESLRAEHLAGARELTGESDTLKLLGSLQHQQIARLVGVSNSMVTKDLDRALDKLRKCLAP